MESVRVLVVEDENIVSEDIRRSLHGLGYRVPAIASSGEEAVTKAAEARPDLVLMDIVLKGEMDGVEAAEQIHARWNIPVIYLTSYADDATLQRAKAAEPFGYLLKPFEDRDLHTAIEMALYKHRAEEEKRQLEQKLLHAQKMESIGTLAGGIAHDFNNLLTSIMGYAELAQEHLKRNSLAFQDIESILKQARRAADLVSQLLAFSRRAFSQREPLDLLPLAQETVNILQRTLPENISIRLLSGERLQAISADATQIQQVLINLATNARDAMPDGGELNIRLDNVILTEEDYPHLELSHPGSYVCMTVRDTGTGMSPEVRKRIFDPFFTTKGVSEGTGLGLAMVYGIIKSHDGYIHVQSEIDKGCTFLIYLPALSGAASAVTGPVEPAAERPPRGSETVMLVEDEASVLTVGQRILESLGYTVLTAENGQEALETYRNHNDGISLVVTDMLMPRMGGLELYEGLTRIHPNVKVLLVSGYSMSEVVNELRARGAMGYVQKPYNLVTLGQAVRQALDEKRETGREASPTSDL